MGLDRQAPSFYSFAVIKFENYKGKNRYCKVGDQKIIDFNINKIAVQSNCNFARN